MRQCAVIDIGGSKVKCMLASPDSDSAILVHGTGVSEYAGYRHGNFPNMHSLAEAIESAVSAACGTSKQRVRSACIGIPSSFIKVVLANGEARVASRSGKITDADVESMLVDSFSASGVGRYSLLHSTPYDITVGSSRAYPPIESDEEYVLRAKVSHVFADNTFLGIAAEALRLCNIAADPFIASCLASGTFVVPLEARKSGAIVVDCGSSHTDVSLLYGDAVASTVCLPVGGRHITNDIALGLRLPLAVAEDLKRKHDLLPARQDALSMRVLLPYEGVVEIDPSVLRMIVDARVEELACMIIDAVAGITSSDSAPLPVYLIGGGIAHMRHCREYFSGALGRIVEVGGSYSAQIDTFGFTTALGLARFMLFENERMGAGSNRLIKNFRELFIS